MIRYNQLITLRIMDKESNEPIGRILDAIYSEDYRKIDYLLIKRDNIIRNKFIIPYQYIHISNNNTVYIKNMEALKDRWEKDFKERFKFIDKEIRNEDGECIGYIKDIVINKENGVIDGFIITEGVLEDLFHGRNYIPLMDSTTIKDDCIYVSNVIIT